MTNFTHSCRSYLFAQHIFGNKIYKTFPKIGRLGLKSGEQEKNSQIGSLPPKSGELEPLRMCFKWKFHCRTRKRGVLSRNYSVFLGKLKRKMRLPGKMKLINISPGKKEVWFDLVIVCKISPKTDAIFSTSLAKLGVLRIQLLANRAVIEDTVFSLQNPAKFVSWEINMK